MQEGEEHTGASADTTVVEPDGPPVAEADAPDTVDSEVGQGVDGLTRDDRRRLRRAWLCGALPTLAVYTWVITAGRADFLQRRFFDDFFDAQGRALAHGHLNVPADVAGIEGFLVDGRTYIYFGPFPALIRLPVLAVTDSFDGRLTALSMLLGMVVLIWAAFRLYCSVRAAVRGSVPVGPREVRTVVPLAVAALAAPPFFLASATIAYHEAAIWGVALSVAGFDAVLRWQLAPTGRRLALASLLIALALLSRQAVALGPLVALALAGAVPLVRQFRGPRADQEPVPSPELAADPGRGPQEAQQVHERERSGEARGRVPVTNLASRLRNLVPTAAPLALALILALGPSVAVHYAKFGQLFGVPFDQQVFTQPEYAAQNQQRMAALEGSSTLQGVDYVSTTTWQYFRPDAFDLRQDFPWIDFPRGGPTRVDDDAVFDTLDWSSSLPTTTPALTALGLAGAVWLVRRRFARKVGTDGSDPDEPADHPEPVDLASGAEQTMSAAGSHAGKLRLFPLVVGAAAGCVGVLTFAYVAHRYVSDLYPLALVGGVAGFHLLAGASAGWSRPFRRFAAVSLVSLVVLGLAVNLALTLEYQRERGHAVPQEWHAELIRWRERLPGETPMIHVEPDEPRPAVEDGTLLVVGDCDQLYAGVRDRWLLVEQGPDGNTCRVVGG